MVIVLSQTYYQEADLIKLRELFCHFFADARKKRMATKVLLAQEIDLKEYRDVQRRQKLFSASCTLKLITADWHQLIPIALNK